jgi:hypothetical protein
MRSEQQIADERKARGESAKYLIVRTDHPMYWLNLGAWLTLVWALESEDEGYPLSKRLANATANPHEPAVLNAPNLPHKKGRNPSFRGST